MYKWHNTELSGAKRALRWEMIQFREDKGEYYLALAKVSRRILVILSVSVLFGTLGTLITFVVAPSGISVYLWHHLLHLLLLLLL